MYNGNEERYKPNPRATSNYISSLFYFYLVPVFYRSLKSDFTEKDLFQILKEDESSRLRSKLETNWKKLNKKHKKLSLHLALVKTFGIPYMIAGVILGIKDTAKIVCIPYAIGKLVSYFSQTEEIITHEEAYIYAGALIACLTIERVITHPAMFWLQHMSMQMRIACCGIMYSKVLRFNKSTMHRISIGHVVNLMSNDVSRFDSGFSFLHFVWIAPLQIICAIIYLYLEVGISCFVGVGFLLILIPMQLYGAKKNAHFRLKTARCTDQRVRLMNEIISGMQVIKMYTWEKPFAMLIEKTRKNEVKFVRLQKLIWAFTHYELYASRIAIFMSLVCLNLIGEKITAEIVFIVIAIYDLINHSIASLFEMAVRCGAEVNVSLHRINEFLNLEETSLGLLPVLIPEQISDKNVPNQENDIKKMTPNIVLKSISAKWSGESLNNTLSNISLHITEPQLFAVIGPVGCGKSTLLHVLLQELPAIKGTLSITGKVSYYSQETWIFAGSIRQNILFGDPFDEKRYRKVCHVCALKTDFRQFVHGDETLVGENGKALSGGQKARVALARCIYKEADIYLLDDPLSAVDTAVGQQLFHECIKNFLSEKICILITHQLQFLREANSILILNEGTIQGCGTFDELQGSGLDFAQLLGEVCTVEEEQKQVPNVDRQTSVVSDLSDDKTLDLNHDQQSQEKEMLVSGDVTKATYSRYFRTGGNIFQLLLLSLLFLFFQVASRGSNYFFTYWVNTEQYFLQNPVNIEEETAIRNLIIYEFAVVLLVCVFFAIYHNAYFFVVFTRASIRLHNSIFSQLLNAKMHFFNTTPIGRILNRFSKDLGVIDESLPTIIYYLTNIAMHLVGIIALTSVVRPLLLPPAILLVLVFYGLRCSYIRCSRSIKRIEGINRSPVFTQVSATFAGLTTIRAFGMEETLTEEFHRYQDEHTSAFWLFIASARAFGMWLDMFCCIFISLVIIVLLSFSSQMNGGDLGLIITQYIGIMGSIQFGMRQWSEMETNMTSVERILEYTQLDSEPNRSNNEPLPKDWPARGKLEYKSLSLKYNEDDPPVLNRISFQVNSCEKIGIVGRTGAGKSSIITALFQLYETSGEILIDDIDVTKISLQDLRSKISIIPQDPILFEGTMRKNLDPFDQYPDDVLWEALEQVKLKEYVGSMPLRMQTGITEGGGNFSVGQRQLVCLARAIIKRNKILVLDEATANVDPHTDELIQETIRSVFADCTVLTIAHRLHTVMDGDKILVVDSGEVAEFGSPYELLQNPHGRLMSMVEKTGSTYAKDLIETARKANEKKHAVMINY